LAPVTVNLLENGKPGHKEGEKNLRDTVFAIMSVPAKSFRRRCSNKGDRENLYPKSEIIPKEILLYRTGEGMEG